MKNVVINENCIKVCNGLLRGELSAVETYGKAIEKFEGSFARAELLRIQTEHRKSVNRLTGNVRDMGGEPETDSGAWGLFANTVQGAANLFGTESAIESLRTGEELGRGGYEEALEDENVMDFCKSMIREELLPRTKDHICALTRLEKRA